MTTREDLEGDDLTAHRFRILSDIAEDLTGPVIFPVNLNVTFRISDALRQGDSLQRIGNLFALEPLTHNQLLRAASRKCSIAIRSLSTALTVLDERTVREMAAKTASAQVVRSRNLSVFSAWTDVLWEQTLDTAAVAGVVTEALTPFDPKLATFAALSRSLPLYYMLYRATQYPDLLARPESLKHLVVDWHDGISDALFSAMDLPRSVIEAVRHQETVETIPSVPSTLGEVLQASNTLASVFFSPTVKDAEWTPSTGVEPHYVKLRKAAQIYRRKLRSIYH